MTRTRHSIKYGRKNVHQDDNFSVFINQPELLRTLMSKLWSRS